MLTKIDAYKTARSRIIQHQSIEHPEGWPKADSGRCCIFEAVNIVGKAMFGPEWTGTELLALHWFEQPTAAEKRRIADTERLKTVPRPLATVGSYSKEFKEAPAKTYDAHCLKRMVHVAALRHARSVADEQALWEQNEQAVKRLSASTGWLAQQCRDGRLIAYYRLAAGGALNGMAPSDWNVEFPVGHFLSKGGYERWFFTVSPPKKWLVYLFFSRSELEPAVLAFAHAPAKVKETDLALLSPYLQFAVKLALTKGYSSPDACDTKPVREAEVRAAWRNAMGDIPESAAQVEMIAGVMGFPDAESIQRGLRGGARRGKGG